MKQALTAEEINELAHLAGTDLKELINKKSQAYKKSGLELEALGEDELIALIQQDGRILKRPILTGPAGILIGQSKEEAYQEFLA